MDTGLAGPDGAADAIAGAASNPAAAIPTQAEMYLTFILPPFRAEHGLDVLRMVRVLSGGGPPADPAEMLLR
jgi:hypothetical protein